MKYTRYYADESGASRTEDIEVELLPRDFVPPAPPLHLTPIVPATGFAFVRFPAGWVSDWHPTPRRQIFVYLSGELEGETNDGECRRFGTGTATLLEDTTGTGHRACVVGDIDVLASMVQLPD